MSAKTLNTELLPDWSRPSLYIHVPLCHSFCSYCDFCSALSLRDPARAKRCVDRLIEDIEDLGLQELPNGVSTIFIGGGTPSALGPEQLLRLLDACSRHVRSVEELSIEINPDSAGGGLLEALGAFRHRALACGALLPNARMRLSFGVQSLFDPSREAVFRSGSAQEIRDVLAQAGRFPHFEISADLIAGLPLQTRDSVLDDIASLVSLGISHLSLYALGLEEGSPLGAAVSRGDCVLPSSDELSQWLEAGARGLEEAGLYQYEVSNFARPGCMSRHNLRYWQMADWLAVGPSASGTCFDRDRGSALRTTVDSDVEAWLKGPSSKSVEAIDRKTACLEFLMMGFRLLAGPDSAEFQRRFGMSIEQAVPKTLLAWRGKGLLLEDRTALSREGLMFLNAFLVDAMLELERAGLLL